MPKCPSRSRSAPTRRLVDGIDRDVGAADQRLDHRQVQLVDPLVPVPGRVLLHRRVEPDQHVVHGSVGRHEPAEKRRVRERAPAGRAAVGVAIESALVEVEARVGHVAVPAVVAFAIPRGRQRAQAARQRDVARGVEVVALADARQHLLRRSRAARAPPAGRTGCASGSAPRPRGSRNDSCRSLSSTKFGATGCRWQA